MNLAIAAVLATGAGIVLELNCRISGSLSVRCPRFGKFAERSGQAGMGQTDMGRT